jgi:peptide/nickel transport system ATP-binding protein/oligopeptide transport system ATP-binding protein
MAENILIESRDLKKYFFYSRFRKNLEIKAVNGVSLSIRAGKTLGLAGESGCGKSTLGRLMLNLIPPTAGELFFDGKDILRFTKKEMWDIRRQMQMIFQNPYAALNPKMCILNAIKAPLDVYHVGSEQEKIERVREIANLVGLNEQYLSRYPHEFSGGQRQRIVIARALILNPKFIVCDEPVSSLDVSVRAQILNLMKDIQEKLNIAYLFISHDLSVVHHISDEVAIMYLGRIVEQAPKKYLYENPLHPYTKALLSSLLQPGDRKKKEKIILQGEVPSPLQLPQGCCFSARCPDVMEKCVQEPPKLRALNEKHYAACHRLTSKNAQNETLYPDSVFNI